MAEVSTSTRRTRATGPTVIYIAGSGRSGSTLLERTLGAIPGFVNVGELLDLPRRVVPGDELCGCGEQFSACPFWSAVGDRLPDGWSAASMAHLHLLQTQVARQRFIPRLLTAPLTGTFGDRLTAYAVEYTRLCSAVLAESGADYVVDASKWPSLALALHRGGVDVRVIHLVRDVRGVSHSLSRDDIARPQSRGGSEVMFTNVPASGAARWLATQSEVDLLAARGLKVARVRYGDFVTDPATTVATALRQLAVTVPPAGLDHLDGTAVTLGPSHGLSGNPSRFRHGRTELRADTRWRSEMSRRDQLMVNAIGLPQVIHFNVGGRPATAPPLTASPATSSALQENVIPLSDPDHTEGTELPVHPLVSVVLPTRGRPELVRDAIASVVEQSYAGDIELIVIHDQEEEDPDLAAPAREGRSILVVSNTHSPGLAGARNSGLDRASGAFIATLDDDDAWHPTKIAKQVQRFDEDPDVIALGAGIRLILPEGKSALWFGRDEHVSYEMLLRNRVKELHSSTLIMRRDAFAKAGRYDEGLPNGYAEDYDFVLRLARVGRIGVVREPLADIRKDGQSYYRGRAANTAPALEHFLGKHPDIAADRRGHARMLGQMAFARSCIGDRRTAVRYAARSVSRWPLSPHAYIALGHLVTGADPAHFAQLARRFGRGMA